MWEIESQEKSQEFGTERNWRRFSFKVSTKNFGAAKMMQE